MPTVEELLAASRAAHAEYRRNLPRMQSVRGGKPQEVAGDPVKAREALERAATLRLQAEVANPDMDDPAWASDAVKSGDHQTLRTFYAEVAARPLPAEALKDRQPVKGARNGR